MAEQDIAMNAFQIVTDVAYIYGEKSDSSQGKIKKGDLFNGLFMGKGVFEGDVDELTQPGMYYINGKTQNVPSGYSGLMVVFYFGRATIQIVYNVFNGEFRKRALLYNGGKWDTWSDWKTM